MNYIDLDSLEDEKKLNVILLTERLSALNEMKNINFESFNEDTDLIIFKINEKEIETRESLTKLLNTIQ